MGTILAMECDNLWTYVTYIDSEVKHLNTWNHNKKLKHVDPKPIMISNPPNAPNIWYMLDTYMNA